MNMVGAAVAAAALAGGIAIGTVAVRNDATPARLGRALVRHRALWPAAALILATVVAYRFTLTTMADYLRLDTPLAYLLLLPFFSLLIAIATMLRYEGKPPAPRELHIDLLVGIPLLLVALLMLVVLPAVWSTYYWTERPDVLSLALFVSGGIVILYGITWFWRLRAAMVFLVLMWPALYLHFMAGAMQTFTDGTNTAFEAIAQHLPLHVQTATGGVITVSTGQGRYLTVALSTACSGANGVLGVILVGSALAVMLRGRRSRKLTWLLAGMLMMFALNVARITSILVLAHSGHPDLALGSYHSVIGLALFLLTLLLMWLVAPLFGLRMSTSAPQGRTAAGPRRRPLGRAALPVAAGLALTATIALLAERDLGSYAAFIDGTGSPTVAAFDANQALPRGWKASYVATYGWAQQYFGPESKFDRYLLDYGSSGLNEAWMDVVRTDDQGSLDAYNLQSCFTFHSYEQHTTERIEIGHGVTALLINYSDPHSKARWATVSWAWPVRTGDRLAYERIALTAELNTRTSALAPDPEPSSGLRGMVLSLLNGFGGHGASEDASFHEADHALEGVAASLVNTSLRGSS